MLGADPTEVAWVENKCVRVLMYPHTPRVSLLCSQEADSSSFHVHSSGVTPGDTQLRLLEDSPR